MTQARIRKFKRDRYIIMYLSVFSLLKVWSIFQRPLSFPNFSNLSLNSHLFLPFEKSLLSFWANIVGGLWQTQGQIKHENYTDVWSKNNHRSIDHRASSDLYPILELVEIPVKQNLFNVASWQIKLGCKFWGIMMNWVSLCQLSSRSQSRCFLI